MDLVAPPMRDRAPARGALRSLVPAFAAAALAFGPAVPAAATPPTAADRDLLAASDLGLAMPAAFRAELRLEPLSGGGATDVEVWRDRSLALVRLLDPRQRGKAFLQRPEGIWLLSRGARPVRLGTASRLASGVSLQELVGVAYSRDYTLEDVSRQRAGGTELVSFALRAKALDLPFPRVTYVVRADTRRPVRIEHRFANGRLARLVELRAWRPGSRPVPAETIAKDLVGGRPPVRVRLLEVEPRQPPPHLFELSAAGEASRGALAAPAR